MCGLCGYISHRKADNELSREQKETRRRIFQALHLAMECRGTDSAGIATLIKGNLQLTKRAETVSLFMKDKTYKKFLEANPEIVIGHTRAATTGLVTDKNAHPFRRGSIVAAHNGIISNYRELDNKVDVDSEVVVGLLHEFKNDFVKAFAEVSGSCALTWFDINKPDRVYLVSHDNPLAVCSVKSLKTVFWVSLKDVLKIVLEAGIGSEGLDIWSPHPDTVYEITDKLEIKKYKVQFKERETTYYGGYPQIGKLPLVGGGSEISSVISGDEEDKEVSGIVDQNGDLIESEVVDFNEDEYSQLEALVWTIDNDSACSNCTQPIDVKKGFWWAEEEMVLLCNRCVKTVDTKVRFISYKKYLSFLKSAEELDEARKKEEEEVTNRGKQIALGGKVALPGSNYPSYERDDYGRGWGWD